MKVLFAVVSLWAAAVFAMRGEGGRRFRYNEVDDRDVEPFQSGQTYEYRLDTQISSGMAGVSDQHAVTRFQAKALINFQTDRSVTLRLNEIVIGTLNTEIQEPERVQPMDLFKEKQIKDDESRLLELPCVFDYADGLVERIRFHPEDKPWSKNIKKSVLNMLQLNLKQKEGNQLELDEQDEWKQERQGESNWPKNEKESQTFVMPEITLEGECQVMYTLNKMQPRQYQSSSSNGNSNSNSNNNYNSNRDSDSLKMFNVTKTIDFHQCGKIAETRYGPKIETPCDNCTIEELEEQKLDRTTIFRHVVVGTTEKYGIKKVEVVSHYLFKMLNAEEDAPMHTIAASELSYIRIEAGKNQGEQQQGLRATTESQKQETLLYSSEWDEQEKLFYMYGDLEYPSQSPFQKITDKVTKVENQMKKLVGMWSDKATGIETEATMVYAKIVELLRMCTQQELNQIYDLYQGNSNSRLTDAESRKAQDIFIDALANAGTYNTIKVFVEKTLNSDIEPSRAARALAQLKNLPAPSDKQVQTLTGLCESAVCSRHQQCKQTCWLTAGAIMGELCDQDRTVEDAVEQKKSICQQDNKKEFVKKIMNQYNKAETRYEKILLLKALGNAGLDYAAPLELEKIIRDPEQEPLVRMQAIDSLRRLRATMPQKIQRILMPIFQNSRERPEVRMTALSQILATIPEKPILDQIGLSLIRDPCRQVKSFVYGVMTHYSESPVEVEKELARHLNSLLKLANINDDEESTLLRGSRYYRIPIYSQQQQEGFFMDLESMVGRDGFLPKHLSVGMDTAFNGLFQKNALELSFTQEDLEQWVEKMMDVYMDYYYSSSSSQSSNKKSSSLRGYRNNNNQQQQQKSSRNDDFNSIISNLGIKQRSKGIDSDSTTDSASPFGMFGIRYGDVDYAMLPFDEETLTAPLKKILQGERPTGRDLENLVGYIQGRPFRYQAAMHVMENSIKIPTSAGFPVRMWHVVPMLAAVEGQVQPKFGSGSEMGVEFKLHPTMSVTHMKRIEVWSPIINTGVETSRSVSINLPLNGKIQYRQQQGKVQATINVPEKSFRLVNVHSMPFTFVTELEYMQQRTPVVKRIENQQLVQRLQHVEETYGGQSFGMPFQVTGEFHQPQNVYNYEEVIQMLMTSENHIHITFQPSGNGPNEIVASAEAGFFQDADSTKSNGHRKLKGFYSKSKFDNEMDQHYQENDDDQEDDDDQAQDSRFDKYIDDFEPLKVYDHSIKLQIQTVGGNNEKSAQIEVQAQCDRQNRHFEAQLNVQRSPMPFWKETTKWTAQAKFQALYPQSASSVQQYQGRQNNKQQQQGQQNKFVCSLECEWNGQQINVKVNGEQARNQQWRSQINEVQKYNQFDAPKIREQMTQKVAFLNKYDIAAEFRNIEPSTKNALHKMITGLKAWNFWNTQTELKSGRDSQITATIVIDPMTHQHANVTIKTPTEIIRIDPMSLPFNAKPFPLIKQGQTQKTVDSFTDLFNGYKSESWQECKVDSRKVRTFDDVTFKAPLTNCYSVLAKDCSSQNPRFAVLMKKLNNGNGNNGNGNGNGNNNNDNNNQWQQQDKALKVITQNNEIQVQPDNNNDNNDNNNNKLVVKINGYTETDPNTLLEYGVDYTEDMVHINTQDISVRFDGQTAWLKISPTLKNTQCGLCGHYNDDAEDEWRMSDNQLTDDLKAYHKSYSMVDEECRNDFEQTHQREQYQPMEDEREYYERDEEYQQRRNRLNDNGEMEPIEKTEVIEYNHKVCFSLKPVPACPEGTVAQKTKPKSKVGFTCLDRSDKDARQLLRQARRYNQEGPLDVPANKPSFHETIQVPTSCVAY